MNIIKKLIKNNWLRGYGENSLSYDDLTLKYNNIKKDKLELFQDFLLLLKLAEANKINGSPLVSFKNECVLCALNPIKFEQKKECSNSNECALINFINKIGVPSIDENSSPFIIKKEKKEEKIKISVSLIDKLNKLHLYSQKDKQSIFGWSPEKFIEWLENERLTENDFHYLYASSFINPQIGLAAKKREKELLKKPKKRKESSFLDKNGNITWYIKNTSPNHIVISDLEIPDRIIDGGVCGVIFNRGNVYNILEYTSLAQIKKSKDLLKQLDIGDLKRLTEKEYLFELNKYTERHPIKPGMK